MTYSFEDFIYEDKYVITPGQATDRHSLGQPTGRARRHSMSSSAILREGTFVSYRESCYILIPLGIARHATSL